MDSTLLVAFVALQLAQHLTELWLARLNRQYTLEPRHQEEAARALRISPEDMGRSVAYAEDRYRFGLVTSWLGVVPPLVFLALGGLGWVEGWSLALAAPLAGGNVAVGLVFFAILGLGSAMLGLPFGLYRTFGIEARHGFNRQTLPGFFGDWFKGLTLAAVLGGLFLAAVLAIIEGGGRHWWVFAWAAVAGFSLLTVWLYPRLLAPLFNEFSPLPDGELKDAILALADQAETPRQKAEQYFRAARMLEDRDDLDRAVEFEYKTAHLPLLRPMMSWRQENLGYFHFIMSYVRGFARRSADETHG